jgi:hypothetical protein
MWSSNLLIFLDAESRPKWEISFSVCYLSLLHYNLLLITCLFVTHVFDIDIDRPLAF